MTDDEKYACLRPGSPERERWLWHEMDPHAELTVTDQWTEVIAAYRRGNGLCGICGLAVDLSITSGWQMPSVDHVVALCNGGEDTRANIQLAHHLCNSQKGRSKS